MNEQLKHMLTSAAEACGKTLEWDGHPDNWQPIYYEGKTYHAFEPDTDDAQCLQMARQLGITIDYEDKCAWCKLSNRKMLQEFFNQEGCDGWHETDRMAVLCVASLLGEML